jgi:UDP-glucose 4-epimerase
VGHRAILYEQLRRAGRYDGVVADLIIGGGGFVGRNLARKLVSEGREVVILDRIPGPEPIAETTYVQGDARDAQFLTDVIASENPEDVYHLAANSDIASGVEDASLDFGDTLMTTIAVRQAIERSPVERLVFASSSAIFGVSDQPLAETSGDLPNPVSWYGKAKLASEFVLESLSQAKPDLAILIVRFPNVVGPLATHGVVFDFVRKLRANPNLLEVLGNGDQTKPYLHVSELIEGIQYFLNKKTPGLSRINIGPPDQVDVRTIAQEVALALGLDPEIQYEDSPFGWPGDVPRYSFDTSLMHREGFAVETTSRSAVRRAAEDLALEWPAP